MQQMSPISKPQLLLYLQLSQIESVYQVAQNPDIMTLILNELHRNHAKVSDIYLFLKKSNYLWNHPSDRYTSLE